MTTEPYKYSALELDAMRKEFAKDATDAQWTLFLSDCERRNLIPGRHVIFRTQDVATFDRETQQTITEKKVILITTIEAMGLIAQRTGQYSGQRPAVWYYAKPENDAAFVESKIPLGKICHAASVEILRKDWTEPAFGIARYDACVQRKRKSGNETIGKPTHVWQQRGEEMTAKCAKADAFRKAFIEECGSLYIVEELGGEELTPAPAVTQVQQPENSIGQTTVIAQPIANLTPLPMLVPPVNNEQASVFADERHDAPIFVPPTVIVARLTPEQIAASEALAKVDPKKLETASRPEPSHEPAPISEAEAIDMIVVPPSIAAIAEHKAPTAGTGAQAPVQVAPAPVSSGSPDALPTVNQFKEFTSRCAVIVRDTLKKAGEPDGNKILKNYLLTKAGKKALPEITIGQWTAILDMIEKTGSPAKVLSLLKAK